MLERPLFMLPAYFALPALPYFYRAAAALPTILRFFLQMRSAAASCRRP